MVNPRKSEISEKIFGAPLRYIEIPSWRRPHMCRVAMSRALTPPVEWHMLDRALANVLDLAEMERLSITALSPGRKGLDSRLRDAHRVLCRMLPLGPIPTPEDLRRVLDAFVSHLMAAKRCELAELRILVAKSDDKRDQVSAMEYQKLDWLDASRRRSKPLRRLGKSQLEDLYDQAHGTYGRILGYAALPRHACSLDFIRDAVSSHFIERSYHRVPADRQMGGDQGLRTEVVRIAQAGDLYLLKGVHTDFLRPFSAKASPILCTGNPEYWNQEGWYYQLYERGEEADRHCSTPFVFTQLCELLEEGDDRELLREFVLAWGGSVHRLAQAFRVEADEVSRYLFQFGPKEIARIWKDHALFVSFKAFEDDRYSLASPWVHLDLFRRLGGGDDVHHWDDYSEVGHEVLRLKFQEGPA